MQYIYKIVTLELIKAEEELNLLGKEGWEVVTAQLRSNQQHITVILRDITNESLEMLRDLLKNRVNQQEIKEKEIKKGGRKPGSKVCKVKGCRKVAITGKITCREHSRSFKDE